METRHVVPAGDLVEHETTEECPCGPDVKFVEGGSVVVHHALDAREREEAS